MNKRTLNYTSHTLARVRELRHEMTQSERRLWGYLRDERLGVKFRRQAPIGRYIVDFVSLQAKMVIELDGIQHFTEDGRRRDERRDGVLAERGFLVLRFSNKEIINDIQGVVSRIEGVVESRLCTLDPTPSLP